jgi:hypothetical protein
MYEFICPHIALSDNKSMSLYAHILYYQMIEYELICPHIALWNDRVWVNMTTYCIILMLYY